MDANGFADSQTKKRCIYHSQIIKIHLQASKILIFRLNLIFCYYISLTDITMLTERKRFNYNVGGSHASSSLKKNFTPSAIKPNLATPRQDVTLSKFKEQKQNHKKTDQLEEVNKRLIEETTRQFKKLESDVHRVQKILEEKESALEESQKENDCLKFGLEKVEEQKKILIQAIFQKDLVIKEYEDKIKQLLSERSTVPITPEKHPKAQNQQQSAQTEPLPETCPKEQMAVLMGQNMELQQELYRIREQLFDANNKVKVLHQQFEAYKILKEIESVQQS